MRLALVYHQFVRRGGLEGYLFEFARRLRERGHDLNLVGSSFGPEMQSLDARVHRIAPAPVSAMARLWKFDRDAARLVPSLDVDATIGFGRTTVQDLHRAGGGCHRVYSRLLPPWKRLGLKNRLELDLERRLYTGGGTRRFVVNAAPIGEQLREEYGVSPDRIAVIHTAVDTARFRPAANAEERDELRGERKGRPVFLFASLNHRRKGLDPLLEVWPEVDADLWIMGKALDARYRRVVRERGIEDRVRYLGNVGDPAPYYRAADFFVHPTFYDACANTVLQAMASGLPSVVSSRDGASEFVAHGRTGLILEDPADTAVLHERIATLLAMPPDARAAMGAAARDAMLPLTWDAHVAKWETLIAQRRVP